jgi:PPOX class probable F420-dependent enzyme
VQEIKLASENSRKSDDENRHRLDSIEASVNDLYKRTGRPGAEISNDSDERKAARRKARAKGDRMHTLFIPRYLPLVARVKACLLRRRVKHDYATSDHLRMTWQFPMFSNSERRFVEFQRIAHLATADARAAPHVVPVCFAIRKRTLYITIDDKPKRVSATALKRLRNIEENPVVAVVVDRYDEDWTRLGWVMLRGHAEILSEGTEHRDSQALLRSRYSQLTVMRIEECPVIAVRIKRVTSWGDLSVATET